MKNLLLKSGMSRQWTVDNIPNSKGLTKAAISFMSYAIEAVPGKTAKFRIIM